MYQSAYRAQEYRQQEVLGASPLHLVVMAYNLAIVACEQKEFEKAVKTITVLRDALDFDYPEVSVGLFRVYQWCLDCIRKGDYASALSSLRELRDAWRATEMKLGSKPTTQPGASASAYSGAARPSAV
jgi:flagellin-specific chaperone FliS